MKILADHIKIADQTEIAPFILEAEGCSPDPKDTVYLAMALKMRCGIWSNDKNLREKQKNIQIFTTPEIMEP